MSNMTLREALQTPEVQSHLRNTLREAVREEISATDDRLIETPTEGELLLGADSQVRRHLEKCGLDPTQFGAAK